MTRNTASVVRTSLREMIPPAVTGSSLTQLVEAWWREAEASGLKPSTHESYRNTMKRFAAFLKHEDATSGDG